ncbi:stalk domain-containing protein [Bacillus salitolerans]|uniref:Stalk domain-containing protein n=1 Tax=Bacillus salitolerans TaxID=1437434 RepID=A0ABW4LLS5_9BACI
MARFIVIFVLILAAGSGSLLYYQWNSKSSDNHTQLLTTHPIHSIVSLVHSEKELTIVQRFNGLTPSTYTLNIPNKIERLQCDTKGDNSCEINGTTLTSHTPDITLTYSIPIKEEVDIWLQGFFVTVSSSQPTEYELEVVEAVNKDYQWVSGGEFVAYRERELIDYYKWRSTNKDHLSLFMSPLPLNENKVDKDLIIYSSSNVPSWTWIRKITPDRLTVVITDSKETYFSNHLVVLQQHAGDLLTLEDQFVKAYLLTLFPPAQEELRPVWSTLGSVLVGRKIPEDRSRQNSEALLAQLSESELESFFEYLQRMGKESYHLVDFDESLSSVLGGSTTFFQSMYERPNETIPLFYSIDKQIVVNNHSINVKAISYNGEAQFPFKEVMEALGYRVSVFSNNETIIVYKELNSWRFSFNQNYFIYNEESYGLLATPLTNINNVVYITEKWLEEIFKVRVVEQKTHIMISS